MRNEYFIPGVRLVTAFSGKEMCGGCDNIEYEIRNEQIVPVICSNIIPNSGGNIL